MRKDWADKYTISKQEKSEQDKEPFRECSHSGCPNHAPFRAPKSRKKLNDYQYFCLEHIQEFNREWDYFRGWSPEQINDQRARDAGWDNPTWKPDKMGAIEAHLRAAAEKMRGSFRGSTSAGDGGYRKQQSRYVSDEEQKRRDALSVFGLQENTTLNDIKIRYRTLVKKHHPDVNKSPKAEERFKIIAEAYTLLKNWFTRTDS